MLTFALAALLSPCGSLVDLIDVGPAMGRAGVVSARATGGEAAYYNPAGLAFRTAPELRIGVQALHSGMQMQGGPVTVGAPWAITAELAAPIPLLAPVENLFAAGVMLQVLPDTLLAIDAPNSTEPIMPYYRNRVQRLVAMPALSLRPHPNIAFGVGVNYFAGLTGLANVRQGSRGVLEADIEEELFASASIHAGVRLQWRGLSASFTYRDDFSVLFKTRSDSYVADGDLDLRIQSNGLYTPESFVWGAAYASDSWDVALEMSWRRWSRWQPPFARVYADVPLPSLGTEEQRLVTQSRFEVPQPRDVLRFGISGGVELFATELGVLWVEGGYAYEESPFETLASELQRSPINLIDGPKHFFASGLRWTLPTLGFARFTLNLAGQVQVMGESQIRKDPSALPDEQPSVVGRQTSNPGYPSLRGGGWNLGGTLSIGVELLPEGSS